MKCGTCNTRLKNEAEEYLDGRADWWICEKCYVTRELEPFDKPETAAEQELHNKLFSNKPDLQPFSETIDALVTDLKAKLEKLNKQQQEPKA